MWRPDDWVTPFKPRPKGIFNKSLAQAYEQGADAMLKSLVKWLDEPCTEHRGILGWLELHRYLCPECRKELES